MEAAIHVDTFSFAYGSGAWAGGRVSRLTLLQEGPRGCCPTASSRRSASASPRVRPPRPCHDSFFRPPASAAGGHGPSFPAASWRFHGPMRMRWPLRFFFPRFLLFSAL